MKTMTAKLIASVLVVSFLVLPADLSAKERRGAKIVITRLDGSKVSGELIAVKRDSLLLLNNVGRDESIDIVDIKSIRIVRRSRAGRGALFGFLGGALTGALLGSGGMEDFSGAQAALILGGFFGAIGGLGGLSLGTIMGVDTTIAVAGEPEALVRSHMENLRAFSREFRLPGGKARAPAPAPAAAETAPVRPRRTPRFRLCLPFTGAFSTYKYDDLDTAQTSFRFTGNVPSGEAGPYPTSLTRHPANYNS
jgi:hypothetical protein